MTTSPKQFVFGLRHFIARVEISAKIQKSVSRRYFAVFTIAVTMRAPMKMNKRKDRFQSIKQ